jgi:predicted esterase
VYEHLTQVLGIPPEHIVLYGRSLGSGPSVYLAEKTSTRSRPVGGLVLHSPFASVFRVVMPDFFGYTVLGDLFPNVDRMQNIQCPVFIAHGEEDKIVPYAHGQRLASAFPQKDRIGFFSTPGMYHNYYETHFAELEMMEALNKHLDYHVLARRLWMRRKNRTPLIIEV